MKDLTRQHFAETWIKNNCAGKDWYYGYICMDHNPNLSLHKPEKLSKARNKMTNCVKELEPILTSGEGESMKPKFIFNYDGTEVRTLNSGDKTQIMVMGCGNVAGTMIPPTVIFKGVRTNAYQVDGASDDWAVKFTKSGWMNGEVFEDWFEFHFLPYM